MTDYSTLEDSQVISYIRQDAKAFDALYYRYLPRLYRYCLQRVQDVQLAEDLSAQVFSEVLEKLMNGIYHEKGSFAAWFFTIARRRLIDHYRKPNLEVLHEALPVNPEIAKQIEDQDQQHQLLILFNELNEEQQELLRLRFGAELTFEEIASLDGRNTAAIKMAIYRILDRLRDRWEEKYGK